MSPQDIKQEKEIKEKRLFIALSIPQNISEYLYSSTLKIKKKYNNIRVVPPGNLHVTLKFLGNTEILKINKIINAINMALEGFGKFYYEIDEKFDAFPSTGNARIIFARIIRDENKMALIFEKIEERLSGIRISREKRKFISHITVARLRTAGDLSVTIDNNSLNINERILCSRAALFESILKPSGAEYIIIEEFKLK